MAFKKTLEKKGNLNFVTLAGDFDVSVADEVINDIRNLVDSQEEKRFFFDLSGVTGIDSSGLGSLVRLLKIIRSAEGTMHLTKPQPKAFRVFEITRLDGFFDFVESADHLK